MRERAQYSERNSINENLPIIIAPNSQIDLRAGIIAPGGSSVANGERPGFPEEEYSEIRGIESSARGEGGVTAPHPGASRRYPVRIMHSSLIQGQ